MKLSHLLSLILALLIGIGLGYFIAYQRTQTTAQAQGAQELKIAVQTLKQLPADESPQFREYLKGRIYSLLAQDIRPDWVSEPLDFGPLDRKYLGSIRVTKGSESDEELYRLALRNVETTPKP